MDASALRWALTIIGVVVLVGIYFYGVQQSRQRQRAARDTFAREEIDSAFIEDEQLREELDNLGQIITDDSSGAALEPIHMNPALEVSVAPENLAEVELFVAESAAAIDSKHLVSHLLMHADQHLITGEELNQAVKDINLDVNAEGLLVSQTGNIYFSSLSAPGHFKALDDVDFSTLGFNCFLDFQDSKEAVKDYELMLKKVDQLVRLLGVKVYRADQQLLTISDVTEVRDKLSADKD